MTLAEWTTESRDIRNDQIETLRSDLQLARIGAISGEGCLTLRGELSPVTPTTGASYGRAGAGTTSTSIAKPTGTANWTAHNLRGALAQIVDGPGTGQVRIVIDNTTTALAIPAIAGLSSASVFQLVAPVRRIGALDVRDASVQIVIEGLRLDAVALSKLRDVTLRCCVLDVSTAMGSMRADSLQKLTLDNVYIGSGASIVAQDIAAMVAGPCVLDNGALTLSFIDRITAELYAKSCAAAALALTSCRYASIGMQASSNSVTPLALAAVNAMHVGAIGLTGTGNTGYGMTIEDGGRYDLTGATLTGTLGDATLEGTAFTWASLASVGAILDTTTLVAVH